MLAAIQFRIFCLPISFLKLSVENTQHCHFNYCFIYAETWFLMLREEYRLRVFENRVPRGIFGP